MPPRPKPTALRAGRSHRVNHLEPVGVPGLGEPPTRLSAASRACWLELRRELARAQVGSRLELLSEALAEYRSLSTSTEAKHAPYAVSAWKRVVKLLLEYGLTRASRARVHVELGFKPAEDPFERFLQQRPRSSA